MIDTQTGLQMPLVRSQAGSQSRTRQRGYKDERRFWFKEIVPLLHQALFVLRLIFPSLSTTRKQEKGWQFLIRILSVGIRQSPEAAKRKGGARD